jgi:hypothetical protein
MDKTGGPAFPSRGGMMFYVPETARGEIEQAVAALDQKHAGLSLRAYVATAALQGILACPGDYSGASTTAARTAMAVQYADALMVELSK